MPSSNSLRQLAITGKGPAQPRSSTASRSREPRAALVPPASRRSRIAVSWNERPGPYPPGPPFDSAFTLELAALQSPKGDRLLILVRRRSVSVTPDWSPSCTFPGRSIVATYDELKSQIEQLKQEADAAREREITEALAQIRAVVTKYDISPEQICRNWVVDAASDSRPGPRPPLYRDPLTGKTWSGRGRAPAWMAGHPRDIFKIDNP
jgi:DNA-binding protein H-NS